MVHSVAGDGPHDHADVLDEAVRGIPQARGAQDVRDAAWRIGRCHPGGIPALALRMSTNADTLKKKLNPNCETHRLSVDEAVDLQVCAGRYDVLYAMAWSLDHVVIPVPDMDAAGVAANLAAVGAEVGDVFRVAQEVLRDGHVSLNERRELAGQISEAIAAMAALLRRL
jgi:hypothetical protein